MKHLVLVVASFSLIACAAAGQSADGLGSPIRTDAAYSAYELTFERGGMMIYGNLYLPASGSAPYPVAILAPGFGTSYIYSTPYAEGMAEEGIAVYIFDFCGGCVESRSGGSMLDMSVLTEVQDMEAVLDGIRAAPFADSSRIFLMGESQGGFVASLLAERRADDVKGAAFLYPAFVIPDFAREQFKALDDVPDVTSALGRTVGRRYYADVFNMDLESSLGKFSKPVLIVHGSDDTLVPVHYAEDVSRLYGDCTLHIIRGAGHGFAGAAREEALGEVLTFLKKLL